MTLHPEELKNIETSKAERKTALIVDDSSYELKNYTLRLKNRGYKVKTASSLEKAKKYSREEFDIAIIDGLGGQCFDIFNIINAKRKIIYTGDEDCIKEAKKRRIKVYDKLTKSIEDILK